MGTFAGHNLNSATSSEACCELCPGSHETIADPRIRRFFGTKSCYISVSKGCGLPFKTLGSYASKSLRALQLSHPELCVLLCHRRLLRLRRGPLAPTRPLQFHDLAVSDAWIAEAECSIRLSAGHIQGLVGLNDDLQACNMREQGNLSNHVASTTRNAPCVASQANKVQVQSR